jgi:phosphoribosyl 1,2-cyclic phosphodiesterase
MAVSISILGSGSSGNCALVSSSRTRIMVDAGFSRRETLRRLKQAGTTSEAIQGIIISHEHSDHVNGLRLLARTLAVPVYINRGTHSVLGPLADQLERVEFFRSGEPFMIGDIEVTPFTIPHDAADPVAFTFLAEGVKLAIVTDLGYVPENVKHHIRGAACLVMESNHDLDMLKVGPYPWAIKQRVMSRVGHLSNDTLADFLANDFDGVAAHLVLAHLSQYNNIPAVARLTAEHALGARSLSPALQVAQQHAPLAHHRLLIGRPTPRC